MAGIAPGLDGYIAAQQIGQQRQQQEMGLLMQLAQMQRQQRADAQAAEMHPLQMEALRSQIDTRNATTAAAGQQRVAQGALSRLMTPEGSYSGPTAPGVPTTVAGNDAEALRMVQEADARGQPMGANVPNPGNVRSLTSMAFPKEYGEAQAKALFREPKTVVPSNLSKLMSERDALPIGHPARAVFDAAIAKGSTHAPGVNIDMKQEGEFGKTVGKEFGEMYTGAIKAEFNAPKNIANYDRLGGLLSQVNTGKFAGSVQDLKASAKALGVDLTAMGIKDDVAPAQAVRQISNMLALELRNPAGGAGMPGAMSDADRVFLTQAIPGLENDPAAIGKMIEYRKLLAKRDQEVGKLARDYRVRTGRFDEGFFDELKAFSDKTPMFPQSATPTPAGSGIGGMRRYNPTTGRIE